MKRLLSYLALALIAVTGLMSCHSADSVIPRRTLSKIYAEMFLVDEQLNNHRELRRMTDTSRVYEAIFNKYGYTSSNFLASQEKYVKDPGRYTRMLKKSVEILTTEKRALEAEQRRIELLENAHSRLSRFAPHRLYLMDTLGRDSLLHFDFQAGLDTIFEGPRLVIAADSLLRAQEDSIAAARADSLAAARAAAPGRFRIVTPEEGSIGGRDLLRENKKANVKI